MRGLVSIFLGGLIGLAALPVSAQEAVADPYAEARAIIAGANRIVTPNGVQENLTVELGGIKQAVNVRGADRDNPILIYLHGGPGAVEMPFAWQFQRPWEDFFTVVQWDQRGAGKTYALNDPAEVAPTMTLEQFRADAIELIQYLAERYGKKKVFLLGHSWGSAVGLSVALERPDLLHAYVGMGQAIDVREAERIGMDWTRSRALEAGDMDAVRAIDALRPYPDSGLFTIDQADGWRKYAIRYGSLMKNQPDLTQYFRIPRLSPEYTAEDVKAWGKGSAYSTTQIWPRFADVSFSDDHRLEVPVVMLLGRHDITVPSQLAADWMEELDAPFKKTIWFENSAHMPMVEEPGLVIKTLIEDVLPLATQED